MKNIFHSRKIKKKLIKFRNISIYTIHNGLQSYDISIT